MTNEQRNRIVELSFASRKASQIYGGARCSIDLIDIAYLQQCEAKAEDAFAALMAAIYEATGGSDGV